MAFGFLICVRALVQYISIKRTWRLLSTSAQERLLFFYWNRSTWENENENERESKQSSKQRETIVQNFDLKATVKDKIVKSLTSNLSFFFCSDVWNFLERSWYIEHYINRQFTHTYTNCFTFTRVLSKWNWLNIFRSSQGVKIWMSLWRLQF